MIETLAIVAAIFLLSVIATVVLATSRSRTPVKPPRPQPGVDYRPGTGDDAEIPRDTPLRNVDVVSSPLLGDVRTPGTPGQQDRPALIGEPVGLALAKLDEKQAALLRKLIEAYANRLTPEAAAQEMQPPTWG